jgi:hypothetical protein
VAYKVKLPGTVNIDLQIGGNGMNHVGESSAMTSVKFGIDPTTFDASIANRNVTLGTLPEMTITACGATSGDFDGNGCADVGDYVKWRNNLGDPTESDINNRGNGLNGVDLADYFLWQASFGNGAGGGSASGSGSLTNSAVPEPAASVLLLIAWLALAASRRAVR